MNGYLTMKRTFTIGTALLIAAGVVTGCGDDAGGSARVPGTSAQQAPKASLATLTIPAGTSVVASLESRLSTDTNHAGDTFVATTVDAIVIDGKTIVPAGARIRGSLNDVQASGRISGRARMTLGFNEIIDAAGKTHAISARPLTMQAASKTHSDVEKIAAGGVLGAVIGGIAGGGKGAGIGAGAGAGAGTVLMLATKGDEVELQVGQRLTVQIQTPLSVQVVAQR